MPLTLDTWSLAALMLAALLLVMLAPKLRARLALSQRQASLAGRACAPLASHRGAGAALCL